VGKSAEAAGERRGRDEPWVSDSGADDTLVDPTRHLDQRPQTGDALVPLQLGRLNDELGARLLAPD
jgi:hypothetical protein